MANRRPLSGFPVYQDFDAYATSALTECILEGTEGYTWPMISLPKPRGFGDYGPFALAATGLLLFLFWLEIGDGLGWTDAVLAFAAAVLCVLGIVLARRAERAKWIARPTLIAYLFSALGVVAWMFGAIYLDTRILHRAHITASQLAHDIISATIVNIAILWYLRRRPSAKRQLP